MARNLYTLSFHFCLLWVLAIAHVRRSLSDLNQDGITVPKGAALQPPVISPVVKGASGNKEDVHVTYDVDGGNVPVFYDESAIKPAPTFSHNTAHAPTSKYVAPLRRRILDTSVDCLKTHMLVTFTFSVPFNGYIYPHNNFAKCLLFNGHNARDAEIYLKHGTCGDQENTIIYHGRTFTDPIIEHRLVIQWDRDIIGEDDSSVIVRCDRPDDYNKTVEWNLEMEDMRASVETNTHPGPRMWMEIQRGEGPRAPPLNDESVYVGDVLTLIFTLSDNVYWFDSNILTCYALDGGEEKSTIEWDSTGKNNPGAAARVFSGEATVIENGCSVKPKLFSHFYKEKDSQPNGDMVTLHYAHFKAFRFPTSMKIIIQCDVQVCYKTCDELPPCSESFSPRVSEEEHRRRRRAADAKQAEGAFDMDRVNLYRSIEVFMQDEGGLEGLKLTAPALTGKSDGTCYSSTTFLGTVLSLVSIILLISSAFLYVYLRLTIRGPSFFTPNKNQG